MPKYPVKQRLRHNGEKYLPGGTVEMGAKEGSRLVAMGVLDKPIPEPKKEPKGSPKDTPKSKGDEKTKEPEKEPKGSTEDPAKGEGDKKEADKK